MKNKEHLEQKSEHLEIWNKVFASKIKNKFQIERVSIEEYWNIYTETLADQYPAELMFIRDSLLSNEEKIKHSKLTALFSANPIEDYIIIKDSEKVVAMFMGWQKESNVYYMQHAIVHKEYRRQGIYSDFLTKLLNYTAKLGFLQVTSCHSLVNNEMLVLKLKRGFYIYSLEVNAEYGPNLWLVYFHNQELKKAFFYRAGMIAFSKTLFESTAG